MTPEEIRKLGKPTKHKITNSLNNKQIGRIYKKEGGELQRELFEKVVGAVNLLAWEYIVSGRDFEFPHSMGKLGMRKCKMQTSFRDGKAVSNSGINWKETLDYWAEDDIARKKKKVIHYTDPWFYRVRYIKDDVRTSKLKFYYFRTSKGFRKRLHDLIVKERLEAFV